MTGWLVHELRLFFVALQFLTRLPVPRWVGFQPDWLHACARHFPAVGACVGAASAGVWVGACALFPGPVAVVLSMLASVALTGAFHEDGLADTCDALGGAVSRDRALEIMKDSRIGTYGAVGLWMVLGLKAAVLMTLPPGLVPAVLVIGHTASRTVAVALMRVLPYAGDLAQAKAKPLAHRVSRGDLVTACAWTLAVGIAMALGSPLGLDRLAAGLLAAAGAGVTCAAWWHGRLGGITGDTLGATQQIAEVSLLLAVLASLRWAAT